MNSVENANSQSHEWLREINHLLPLCSNRQASHCQVGFLNRQEGRDCQQPCPRGQVPRRAEKCIPAQRIPSSKYSPLQRHQTPRPQKTLLFNETWEKSWLYWELCHGLQDATPRGGTKPSTKADVTWCDHAVSCCPGAQLSA